MDNQPNQAQNFVQQPMKPDRSKLATASFVLGLVGIIAWLLPLFGYPVCIVGIILGGLSLKSAKRKFALIGLILSIVFLLVTTANSIIGAILAVQYLL